jgi:uncharacterized protein (TIRG00374 family)
VKRRLIVGIKLALAVGLIWWLIVVNVTAIDVATAELTGPAGEPGEFTSGEIVAVLVEEGQVVDEGQAVLRVLVEGREIELSVVRSGSVGDLGVAPGDQVDADTVVLTLASAIPFSALTRVFDTWHWFLFAQVPFGIVLLLAAWRWRMLLQLQGIEYSFRETHSLILIGTFFNQVMLGSTGGDVVKAYYVAVESPDRRTAGVLTVLLDRVIGLVVLVLIASVAVLANLELVLDKANVGLLGLSIGLYVGLAAAAIGALVFFSKRVRAWAPVAAILKRLPMRERLKKIADAIYVYRSHPRAMLRVFGVSVGIHLLVVATNLLLLRCLEPTFPPGVPFLLLVPLAQIIMAVPLTPASLGTAETAYDKLFALVGVPTGALVSILQRLTYYFWAVPGCVAYLRRKSTVRKALEASEADRVAREAASTSNEAGAVGAENATTENGSESVQCSVEN